MTPTGLPELTMKTKLASNLQWSSCLRLSQTEIRGVSYHIQKDIKQM